MRHTIANALNSFTDGESHIIGTVKFTNVDGTNHHHLSKAIEMMKDAGRGTWVLVQAYNKHPEYDRICNQHSSQQRRLSNSALRVAFVPPLDSIAKKAGYIVFKDSKVVLFYTNDLMKSSPEPIVGDR